METLKKFFGKLKTLPEKLIKFWYWLKGWFVTYHLLKVSYNATWGDSDDQEFIVSKFFKKQPNYIKFRTQEGEIVEIRGAEGLNYRIQEL